jgi:hypothetical protein
MKFAIDIYDCSNNLKEKILLPPENYYTNQLIFFTEAINGKRNVDDLFEQSAERVYWMEKIMQFARQKI